MDGLTNLLMPVVDKVSIKEPSFKRKITPLKVKMKAEEARNCKKHASLLDTVNDPDSFDQTSQGVSPLLPKSPSDYRRSIAYSQIEAFQTTVIQLTPRQSLNISSLMTQNPVSI